MSRLYPFGTPDPDKQAERRLTGEIQRRRSSPPATEQQVVKDTDWIEIRELLGIAMDAFLPEYKPSEFDIVAEERADCADRVKSAEGGEADS